jgi:F420-non-reducing hydrogenase small subunit
VEFAFFPAILDAKRADLEALPDGDLLVAFVNGAIRTSEHEEMARLLRAKAQRLVGYGACAQLGGVPALANLVGRTRLLDCVYSDLVTVDNPQRTRPAAPPSADRDGPNLPELRRWVRALGEVVDVDYYVPGCPPTPEVLSVALRTLLGDDLPPKGAVLAADAALCEQCPRRKTRPEELQFTHFARPHLVTLDPEQCFLAQGVVCMGPATRAGCGALCVQGNMPCTGCFGPTSRVRDQGAKMISSLASSIASSKPQAVDEALAGIPDPVGTFYRYGLAASLLRGGIDGMD